MKIKILVVSLLMLLAFEGTALAYAASGYESDDNENSVVKYCFAASATQSQRDAIARATDATNGWDKYNAISTLAPNINQTTSNDTSYPACEVVIREEPPLTAGAAAELQNRGEAARDILRFRRSSWLNATDRVRQFYASHETGHTVGLAHDSSEACEDYVMKLGGECTTTTVRRYPGPSDQAAIIDYWIDTPIYPNEAPLPQASPGPLSPEGDDGGIIFADGF